MNITQNQPNQNLWKFQKNAYLDPKFIIENTCRFLTHKSCEKLWYLQKQQNNPWLQHPFKFLNVYELNSSKLRSMKELVVYLDCIKTDENCFDRFWERGTYFYP